MRLSQTLADFPRPYIRSRGAWLAVRAMIVGSAMFALLEALGVMLNTYVVQQIETTWDSIGIVCCVGWPAFIAGIGITLGAFPAVVLGKVLEALVVRCKPPRWAGTLAGVAVGTLGGLLICTPILWLQYNFVSQTGHGSTLVFEYRAMLVVCIATLCGGWTGLKLTYSPGQF